jgi:hypothetical protein
MSTPPKVLELVDLFRRNTDAYHAPQYNEAMVRQEFINPLFKCLGWDTDNEQGYAKRRIEAELITLFTRSPLTA